MNRKTLHQGKISSGQPNIGFTPLKKELTKDNNKTYTLEILLRQFVRQFAPHAVSTPTSLMLVEIMRVEPLWIPTGRLRCFCAVTTC